MKVLCQGGIKDGYVLEVAEQIGEVFWAEVVHFHSQVMSRQPTADAYLPAVAKRQRYLITGVKEGDCRLAVRV